MKLVRQKLKYDCGVASLSMATGIIYSKVKKYFHPHNFSKDGITNYAIDSFLHDHGFSISNICKYRGFANAKIRKPWPPKPFADIHICQVLVSKLYPMAHFIVMLKDGSVYDPAFSKIRKISDYYKVYNVTGIYKME